MWIEDRKAISSLFILSHHFLQSETLVIIRSVYHMIDLLVTENLSKRTNKHRYTKGTVVPRESQTLNGPAVHGRGLKSDYP